ncbi:MAG: FHA domain-containing protein [Isosphaeraceae bacterium]
MPARLVSLSGQADIRLTAALMVVGRDRCCNVRIHSAKVSRRHCCLAHFQDTLLVRDLGSTNGIEIDGSPAIEGRVRPGGILSIAHLRYRFEADPSSAGSTSSTASHAPHPATATEESEEV